MVTVVVPAIPVQPFSVAVTEYVPAFTVVAAVMTGFCVGSEKPFGPVHAYVDPPTVLAVKLRSLPEQSGALLDATGVAGV